MEKEQTVGETVGETVRGAVGGGTAVVQVIHRPPVELPKITGGTAKVNVIRANPSK